MRFEIARIQPSNRLGFYNNQVHTATNISSFYQIIISLTIDKYKKSIELQIFHLFIRSSISQLTKVTFFGNAKFISKLKRSYFLSAKRDYFGYVYVCSYVTPTMKFCSFVYANILRLIASIDQLQIVKNNNLKM